MGEILEKGLLIGFGLSVSIFFFAIVMPYFSIIFSNAPTQLDQHDTFVFTVEYALSYYPQQDEELRVNMSLTEEFSLFIHYTGENLALNISSPSKTTLLSSSRVIFLCNTSITGEIETVFTYAHNEITLIFWGRTPIFAENLAVFFRKMPMIRYLNKSKINHSLQQLLLNDFSIHWEQVVFGSFVLSSVISVSLLGLFTFLKLKIYFYLIPIAVVFGLSLYLIRYFPKFYQNQSDEIDKIFPLLRNCIDLFVTYLPQKYDISLLIVHFLTNVPSPIQHSFKKIQQKVQNGASPEALLRSYNSPSKLLNAYLSALIQCQFNSDHISLQLDNPLENRYSVMSKSLESRISLSFFFGIFIPLGFSLGVFLQKISGMFIVISSPLLFCILYYLTKQLSKDNSLLLGTLSHKKKEIHSEYSKFWDFFYVLASKLPRMSPEIALVQALESTPLLLSKETDVVVNQFKSHSLSLEEFMGKIHHQIEGIRMKLIFGTIKLMIITSSKLASENIIQLLKLLKHHQQLEIHRIQSMKAEIFKVQAFQIILPLVIALITSIFFYTSSTFPNTLYQTSLSLTPRVLILFSVNQILSVNISIYFFRKIVRLKNSRITILIVTSICIVAVFVCYIVFKSVSVSF